MTNWTELKRLAEEAVGIEWHADMAVANDGAESRAIYHRPTSNHVVEIIETPDSALDNADCIHSVSVWQFVAAANPKTILALIAENERLRADGNDVFGLAQARADTIDQLRAEVDALRKDAERYRWIRKNNGDDGLCELCIPQGYSWIPFSDTDGESLDMTIDTAMDRQ